MKALILRYAERIDAASLRERVLIFLALALVLVFVVNAALLDPLRAKQRRVATENAQRQEELRTLQAQLQRLFQSGEKDPDAGGRRRQAALRAELAELTALIAREQRRFTAPDRMRSVLQELLVRHRGLSLVDMKTLAPASLAEAARGPRVPGLFRHGIELTVTGSYVTLYEYLRAMEQLSTQLYWGRAELAVGDHPAITLKITVYTLSFDKTWLIV
jgi:MSHA biogenesis protein MshJ